MTMTMRIGLGAAIAALALGGCGRQANMSCPALQNGQAGGIDETPAQARQTGAALGTGSENEIASVVPQIQARHPGLGADRIANYLIVAYCPVIAARDSAPGEKKAALDAFAERARRIAASMPH